jgi:hypothetical protein
VQRGQLQSRTNTQTVFSVAGIRKEVNAVLEHLETSSQKLGKSMDETLRTVAESRAAGKLMPDAASALNNMGRDSSSNAAAVRRLRRTVCSLFAQPWIYADCLSGLFSDRSSCFHVAGT